VGGWDPSCVVVGAGSATCWPKFGWLAAGEVCMGADPAGAGFSVPAEVLGVFTVAATGGGGGVKLAEPAGGVGG
jgi:hypothetical protein